MAVRNRCLRLAQRGSVVCLFILFLLATSAALAATPSSPARREGGGQSVGESANEGTGADESAAHGSPPSSVTPDLVNAGGAKGLPRRELDRAEAIELAQALFRPTLDSASFPYDELEAEKFLSNRVARIGPGDQPVLPGAEVPAAMADPLLTTGEGTTLLESGLPLRAKDSEGDERPVDLALERSEASLVPGNPLVEVALPTELGEGVEFPESGISVEFLDTPASIAPSILDESAVFYPNVADDTDLLVAPIPTGVETLSQVRSADAPRRESYRFSLPQGVKLQGDGKGGAEAVSGSGDRFLKVPAPVAIDAAGKEVGSTLGISGDSISVSISPDGSTAWPVLVDPLIQIYSKSAQGFGPFYYYSPSPNRNFPDEGWELEGQAWRAYSGGSGYNAMIAAEGMAEGWGPLQAGQFEYWRYRVPNFSEPTTTFVSRAVLQNLTWGPNVGNRESPFVYAGIRSPVNWVSYFSQRGGAGYGLPAHTYEFLNAEPNAGVKEVVMGMYAKEYLAHGEYSSKVEAEGAIVELSEPAGVHPEFGKLEGPEKWMGQSALPIGLSVSDSGLGIYAVKVTPQTTPAQPGWTKRFLGWPSASPCTGLAGERCPAIARELEYSPSTLPTGVDKLQVVAEDPLGRTSAPATVEVKVDHTAPNVALSGTITEQASLGTKRPSYSVAWNATDGTASAPQSGVAKTVVKVDGKVVDEIDPGCATRNCAISREWTLESGEYSDGKHTIEVTATDEVGVSTTKTLTIELDPLPKLTLSGTLRNEAEVGTTRSTYDLHVGAEGEPTGEVDRSFAQHLSFGSEGSGPGELRRPGQVAIDPEGNVWVADAGNDRVEEFDRAGEYVGVFGEPGVGEGQLEDPQGIAIDPEGDIWIADTGNDRIEEFGPWGETLLQFGEEGSGNGRLSEPTSLAIDPEGDLWVADARNDRVEEFGPEGEYIAQFELLGFPVGVLALDGEGGFWAGYYEGGCLIDWAAEGQGEMQHLVCGLKSAPSGIATDAGGDVWVTDPANGRVEEYEVEGDEPIAEFGEPGSGEGRLEEPQGIATDAGGDIWVADGGNDRVEKWQPGSPPPSPPLTLAIKVDGEPVESAEAPCSAEACSVSSGWTLDASHYPAGQHRVIVEATDAAGNVGTRSWIVELNHDTTPPVIALSGTMTQQESLGTKRPSYTLRLDATDGTTKAPQSGVAKTVVKVDGAVVDEADPGCATQSCSVSREWILKSGDYSDGPHTVEVAATDEVGLSTTKTLTIELASAPMVELSGTMAEVGRLGAERPRYNLDVEATGGLGDSPIELSSFGDWEPGQMAIDAQGHIWVTHKSSGYVAEYSPAGEWLSYFEGSGDSLLDEPDGVAIDPEGDVWVADAGNDRVEEFGPDGEYLARFGEEGSGEGQLSGPTDVAIDPEGDVWVADSGNDRVEEFGPEGQYIAQFELWGLPVGALAFDGEGGFWAGYLAGDGEGCLVDWGTKGQNEIDHAICGPESAPAGIAVDSEGNVWVTDSANDQVSEYEVEGEVPLAEFGEPGSGEGQLDEPGDIAIDPEGNLWVADTGNERIQEWGSGYTPSSISTEIKVDGEPVESAEAPCGGEGCSVTSGLSLDASGYSAGKHTVAITAKESPGRMTKKTLQIELQPDTTGPKIEIGGELGNAPAGWVEQESYGFHVATKDGGTGVTSTAFKIDGDTVASESQECVEGGCEGTLSRQVDMSSYEGGAHEAEVIATDAAGNSTTKSWTINVDPEGHIGTSEAEDTLEAMDETSESTAVASNDELLAPEQMEGGDNPTFQQDGGEITSTGVPDTTSLTTNLEAGITIESPEGETVIVPLVGEGTSSASVAGEVAAVSANTDSEVDSVVRPEYNGIQYFEDIRSSESPEAYSWRVRMSEDQSLKLVNPQQAEVVYEDGTESFLVTAERAKDATGAEVPTHLEVNGNVLTLKVEHRSGSYVYPIMAANYWETSFVVPIEVEKPEDEIEIREREEREQRELEEREREEREAEENGGSPPPPPPPSQVTERMARRYAEFGPERDPDVAAPPLPPPGAATASDVRYYQIYRSSCGHSCDWWKAKLYNATFIRHAESAEWEHGTQVDAHVDQSFLFEAVIFDTTWNCGAVGPDFVRKGSGEHLIAYAHFTIEVPWAAPSGETMAPFENNFALQDWIYPNGYQEKHVKPWDGEPNGNGGCPTTARP
jgi:streptogramin lyase